MLKQKNGDVQTDKAKFSIKARVRSFKYAFSGIKVLFKEEHNARIHFLASLCVIGFGLYFKITQVEWVLVLLCIGMVFMAEAVNSAVEQLADKVCAEQDEKIKAAKDLAAAGVLIVSFISAVIGIMILLPYVRKTL